MIKLKSLEMVNFLSHLNSFIDFYHYDGMTLISGINEDGRYDSNGSGKSTILEGVYYALTGKTLRGLTADGVINRVVGSNCEVTLTFFLGTNTYRISRYRGHDKYGNSVKFFINEEDKSQRLPTDTQSLIDDLLDTPADILVGVMLMGEGLSSKFTSLSDPDKKRMLEQTIRMTHNISLSDRQVMDGLSKISNEVSELSGYISACERSIEVSKSTDISEYDKLIGESRTTESELLDYNNRIPDYDKSISSIQDKMRVIDTTVDRIHRLESAIEGYQLRVAEVSSKISDVSNTEKPICPTCGQVVDNTSRLIESLDKELQNVQSYLRPTIEELGSLPKLDVLFSKRSSLDDEMTRVVNDRNSVRDYISNISNKLSDIRSRIAQIEQVKSLSEDMAIQIKESKEKLVSLSERKDALEYIHKKIFSSTGIISDILTSVVEFINSRLSVYTNILLDKPMSIEMNAKGKISMRSLDGDYTYNSLSNGEKRRLDISIQFALHDYCYLHCGLGLDVLFIDEVLDTLDNVGVSNILQVLKMKMDFCNLSRIFVVTHNDDLKSYFDSSIIVSKNSSGVTTIIS